MNNKYLSDNEFDYILQNGESYLVEFKEKINNLLSREITAFANASGGRIFIGVTDSGEPKGIEITNKLRSQIQDIANNCQPAVQIKLEEFNNILIIIIPEGKEKPYQCSDGFYVRMGANARKMKRDQIIDFLQFEGQLSFEEQFHKKFDFERDYSPSKLSGFLKFAGITQNLDDETILINLGVAEKLNGKLRMKNAGVLFFTDTIQILCEQATITCAVFDGTERIHILNRKDYAQDIITNIDNALHFVKQELRVKYEMTGTARRKEIYELPLDAIREAVINAVVHRDYFLKGSHTVIEIFDDRIEISNPGGLPKGLSEKDFGKKAVRRNQIIASLLHRIDFVENMGTGINKIRNLLKESKAKPPKFEFGDFYSIIFQREVETMGKQRNKDGVDTEQSLGKLDEGGSIGGAKGGAKGGAIDLTERQKEILSLINQNNKISYREIAKKLEINNSAILKHLNNLKSKGVIKRIGGTRGYWQVIDNEK
ncbi:MAG: putative DNA binding domain-containing protein [Candidatus Cloacimonetes bacterium]|nr:putative DNA binding domain-containing protein [Candidatus Cloacimonadota bacterium]